MGRHSHLCRGAWVGGRWPSRGSTWIIRGSSTSPPRGPTSLYSPGRPGCSPGFCNRLMLLVSQLLENDSFFTTTPTLSSSLTACKIVLYSFAHEKGFRDASHGPSLVWAEPQQTVWPDRTVRWREARLTPPHIGRLSVARRRWTPMTRSHQVGSPTSTRRGWARGGRRSHG